MAEAHVEVVVWTDAAHVDAVRRLLDVMGGAIDVIAVGGPRGGGVAELAHALDQSPIDDLRHMLTANPAAFLLLASDAPPKPADLAAAQAGGTHVLSLEPVAERLDALETILGDATKETGRPAIVTAPRFTACPGFLSAAEPFDVLGDRRVIGFESIGRGADGSLFGRLYDAWRLVLTFCEMPESIDALHLPADGDRAESLPELHGRMTAHARVPGAGSAAVVVSDRGGEWLRTLRVLGDGADLHMTDAGYRLIGVDGQPIDEDAGPTGRALGHVDLVATQWRRLIERVAGLGLEPGWLDREKAALACCEACLLSHRTGQPESPGTILRMGR